MTIQAGLLRCERRLATWSCCVRQSVRDSCVTAAAAADSAADAVVHVITHCDVTTTPSQTTGTPALADVVSPSS